MHQRKASTQEIADSIESPVVEIRVHGIGDHGDWDALGSPALARDPASGQPDVALPPAIPAHPVRLINWSRTSRRVAGLLWFIALPYTLVNVAGYMLFADPVVTEADSGATSRRLRAVAVTITSIVVSLVAYVWLVAIVETLYRGLFPHWASARYAGQVLAGAVGLALAFAGVARRRFRPTMSLSWSTPVIHAVVLLSATVFVVASRPNHHRAEPGRLLQYFATFGPGPRPTEACQVECTRALTPQYWDPVTIVAVCSILIVVTLGLCLLTAAVRERKTRPLTSTATAASALVLVSAVLVVNGLGSALRLTLDNLFAYLKHHDLVFTFGEWGAQFDGRVLLTSLNHDIAPNNDYAIDLIPLLGLTALVAFGISVLLMSWSVGETGRPVLRARSDCGSCVTRKAQWVHLLITRLASYFPFALVVTFPIWWCLLALTALCYSSEQATARMVVVVQVSSFGTAAVFLAGRGLRKTNAILGSVADVMGFWPVRWHPLAGASYRDNVVKGIRDELDIKRDRARALVGHSQGSVLAAWVIAQSEDDHKHTVLVTCGSPLKSLYATLFPHTFDAAFFERVRTKTRAWQNYWRATDPIATSLFAEGKENAIDCQLEDPPEGLVFPLAHGDYWIDPEQSTWIAGQLSADQPKAPPGR